MFFAISAIVGVGFATGKEVSHFFLSGKSLIIAVIVFFFVFVGLSLFFLNVKKKYSISNLNQLNRLAFGKFYEVGNIVLMVLFIVTSSAMLSGCETLARNYLNINIPIISIFLSIVTFFIVVGGINRIKTIANILMPILLIVIVVNSVINFGKVSSNGNIAFDICYPIIFCCENFITLISVLLTSKSKPKHLSIISGIVVSLLILFSAFAIGNLQTDMPMLTLSKNAGNIFFAIYLVSVIFALFTTLEISVYHCLQVSVKSVKYKYFFLAIILLTCQIISYLGFNFIVKYLYTGVGIIGAIYLVVLIIRLIIINKKFR